MINGQAQKVVPVAYRRWSFTRDSNCKALTGKVLVFWIGVDYDSWSLTRGGRTWRFDCIQTDGGHSTSMRKRIRQTRGRDMYRAP